MDDSTSLIGQPSGRVETAKKTRPLTVSEGPWSSADVGREVLAGEGGAGGDAGCALEDDPAAVVPSARARSMIQSARAMTAWWCAMTMAVDQPVEQAEQVLDVGQVQAGGRLVEDVHVALLGHLGGQLHAAACRRTAW